MAENIIIAPSAPPAGSPPFVGGNLCCLDRLLSGRRGDYGGWDRSLGFCEFMPVVFNQNADGTISLSGQLASAEGTEGDRAVVLPLAHGYGEAQCPSRMAPNPCTAVRDDIRAPPKLLLGACVLVVADEIGPDGQKISRVLLTRRARHMRTFAGAWVPPGGGVDPGESAAYAALRELQEETGIVLPPAHCRPFCIWESAFPTSFVACRDAGGLKRQQLVVYYVARICGALAASARSALHFGAPTADGLGAEVDRACWLPVRVSTSSKDSDCFVSMQSRKRHLPSSMNACFPHTHRSLLCSCRTRRPFPAEKILCATHLDWCRECRSMPLPGNTDAGRHWTQG